MERNGREMLGTGDRGGARLPPRPAPSPCHMALLRGLGNDVQQGTLARFRRAETDQEDGREVWLKTAQALFGGKRIF